VLHESVVPVHGRPHCPGEICRAEADEGGVHRRDRLCDPVDARVRGEPLDRALEIDQRVGGLEKEVAADRTVGDPLVVRDANPSGTFREALPSMAARRRTSASLYRIVT